MVELSEGPKQMKLTGTLADAGHADDAAGWYTWLNAGWRLVNEGLLC